MLYPSELLARSGRASTLAEGAKRGNVIEHYYSIRYESRALAGILGRLGGSSFRAVPDFLCQFFKFIGLAQHGDKEYLYGISFFHFGFQFARQIVKLLNTFLDFLLIRFQDQFRIEFWRIRVVFFGLLGVLRALAADLRTGQKGEDHRRRACRDDGRQKLAS